MQLKNISHTVQWIESPNHGIVRVVWRCLPVPSHYLDYFWFIDICIQLSAVITRSNIVRYYINDYRNWGNTSIRYWIHKRARYGVSFVKICEKIDRVNTASHCIWEQSAVNYESEYKNFHTNMNSFFFLKYGVKMTNGDTSITTIIIIITAFLVYTGNPFGYDMCKLIIENVTPNISNQVRLIFHSHVGQTLNWTA